MMIVVAHAIALNHVPLMCFPINSLLFTSSSMKISTNGSTMPFTTCDRMLIDRKSTRLNSSHLGISYAVFCLNKKFGTEGSYDAQMREQLSSEEQCPEVQS